MLTNEQLNVVASRVFPAVVVPLYVRTRYDWQLRFRAEALTQGVAGNDLRSVVTRCMSRMGYGT